MYKIRKLINEDFKEFVMVAKNAYPGTNLNTPDVVEGYVHRLIKAQNDTTSFYGCFIQDKLVGGMRIRDLKMNVHSTIMNIGTLGFLEVDMIHKKERIAKNMTDYFMNLNIEKGNCIVALVPFRPDFYKKMGFGYGPKINAYFVKTSNLPRGHSKKHLEFIKEERRNDYVEYFKKILHRKHGYISMSDDDIRRFFFNPNMRVVGYIEDEEVKGCLVFRFEQRENERRGRFNRRQRDVPFVIFNMQVEAVSKLTKHFRKMLVC